MRNHTNKLFPNKAKKEADEFDDFSREIQDVAWQAHNDGKPKLLIFRRKSFEKFRDLLCELKVKLDQLKDSEEISKLDEEYAPKLRKIKEELIEGCEAILYDNVDL